MTKKKSLKIGSIEEVQDELKNRIQRAWDAYGGNFPNALRPTRGADDNVKINRCRPIVDKGVSFLFGQAIRFDVDESAGMGPQDYLDAVWKDNRQASLLQRVATNGGVCGHAFIRIYPSVPYPKLKAINPATVTVTTLPDDVDTIIEYSIDFTVELANGETEEHRQLISLDGDTWKIVDQVQIDEGQWQNVSDVVTWAYPFAPIVECQNLPMPNQHWGASDIDDDLQRMNRDLNFILSNMARILRFHAHPKMIAKNMGDLGSMKTGPDGIIILPDGDSSLNLLEMHNNLSSSSDMANQITSAMDELSRVPAIALGVTDKIPHGVISGLALQILYQPLIEKTNTKRSLYGDMLIDLNTRLLYMAGWQNVESYIHWPDLLPHDELADAQTVQVWSALGVSKQTQWAKLGLDPEVEKANLENEQQEADAKEKSSDAKKQEDQEDQNSIDDSEDDETDENDIS